MKTIFIITVAFCLLAAYSCNVAKRAETENKIVFPQGWYGNYTGELQIITPKGIEQTLQMELAIAPGDSSHRTKFTIVYAGEPRKYELVAKNPATGDYIMDEKNGIYIASKLLGNTLYSRFDVMGNDLLSSYTHTGEAIHTEIVVSMVKPFSISGSKGDSIPKVEDFMVVTSQKAILVRQKKK